MIHRFTLAACIFFIAVHVTAQSPQQSPDTDALTAICQNKSKQREKDMQCDKKKSPKEREDCMKKADVSALEKDYFKQTPDKKTKKVSIDACVSKEKIEQAFGPKCNEMPACKENGVSLVSRTAYNSAPNKFEACGSRNNDIAVCRKKDEETEKKNEEAKKNNRDNAKKTALGGNERASNPYLATYYGCAGMGRNSYTCYGGDGRPVEENRLRSGDIALPREVVSQYELRVGDKVVLENSKTGESETYTYRDINDFPRFDIFVPHGEDPTKYTGGIGYFPYKYNPNKARSAYPRIVEVIRK